MKIIKEPNLSLTCPVCGCEFEFDKNDVYNATGGARKGIPKNPHKAVLCPVCNKFIPIWGNKKSKDNEHDDNPSEEDIDLSDSQYKSPRCPNCGVHMRDYMDKKEAARKRNSTNLRNIYTSDKPFMLTDYDVKKAILVFMLYQAGVPKSIMNTNRMRFEPLDVEKIADYLLDNGVEITNPFSKYMTLNKIYSELDSKESSPKKNSVLNKVLNKFKIR